MIEINVYYLAEIPATTLGSTKFLLAKGLRAAAAAIMFWTAAGAGNLRGQSSNRDLKIIKQEALLPNGVMIYGSSEQKQNLYNMGNEIRDYEWELDNTVFETIHCDNNTEELISRLGVVLECCDLEILWCCSRVAEW